MIESKSKRVTEKRKVYDLYEGVFKALAPDPVLSISEWSDRYRQIPEGMAEAGRWRTSRTPYLRDIMDAMGPTSSVNRIVVMKGAQLGFTEALINVLFYYIHYVPSSQMMLYPTVETAQRTSKTRIEKSLRGMPEVKNLIGERRQKEGSNTILVKEYPGGQVFFSGSNSPASLSSTPIKIMLMDEVDRFAKDCGGEGTPSELAEKRTSTYASTKKAAYISTPVDEEDSVIEREFNSSDQHYCYVPCPHCNEYQTMEFENLDYEVRGKDAYNAKLKCKLCGQFITESYKTWMLSNHKWKPHAPQNKKTRGYFINGLYAPSGWVSWTEIADEREKARGDREKEKVFRNTREGLTFKSYTEVPDIELIYSRREPYEMGKCPHGVLFLTLGADVQANRIEVEVVGFGINRESWSIDHLIFEGETNEKEVWETFKEWIEKTQYSIEGSSYKLPIQVAFVDSGYRTQKVYNFCRQFKGERVFPIKGRPNYDKAVSPPSFVDVVLQDRDKRIKNGVGLYHVGVSMLKEQIYSNLKLPVPKKKGEPFPPYYPHYPEYDHSFFQSLCSEVCLLKTVRGRVVKEWKKVFERNEVLDIRVYATAAASYYGFDTMTDKKLEAWYNELYYDSVSSEKPIIQEVKKKKASIKLRRRRGTFMEG